MGILFRVWRRSWAFFLYFWRYPNANAGPHAKVKRLVLCNLEWRVPSPRRNERTIVQNYLMYDVSVVYTVDRGDRDDFFYLQISSRSISGSYGTVSLKKAHLGHFLHLYEITTCWKLLYLLVSRKANFGQRQDRVLGS
jgi:hypothetical protein